MTSQQHAEFDPGLTRDFAHHIISARMSSRKKKQSCPFSSAKGRPKKAKNTFDKEWAAKLAKSDKGSYYNQEKLLDELDRNHEASKQAEMSASRRKIQLQETVEAEEIEEEKWTKLKRRSIVSGERLQKNVSGMRFYVAFVKEM